MNPREMLKNLIDGRQGIIAIRTHEHDRIKDVLWGIASEQEDWDLLRWTSTDGLRQVVEVDYQIGDNTLKKVGYKAVKLGEGAKADMYKQPPGAIMAATDFKPDPKGGTPNTVITMIDNIHAWLKEQIIQQHLLDASERFLRNRRTIVLVSPHFDMPPELSKAVMVIDWPLPTADEITTQVNGYIAAVNTSGLFEEIGIDDDQINSLTRALQGMSQTEVKHALNMLLTSYSTIRADDSSMALLVDRKAKIIRATRALTYIHTDEHMANVGGLWNIKKYIDETAASMTAGALAYGAKPPRGFLLIGPPGTGKSLLCKCMAARFNLPLVLLDAGSLFSGIVGSSEQNARNAFAAVEAMAPCVLWIDEVDRGFGGGSGGELDGGTSDRVMAFVLRWIQESARDKGIVCAMTSNSVSRMDPALFQRMEQFVVRFPDAPSRDEILRIHLAKNGRPDPEALGIDIAELVELTEGFSGREIEEAIFAAIRKAYLAITRGEHEGDITQEFLAATIVATVPLSTTMEHEMAAMEAWAEIARDATYAREGNGNGGGMIDVTPVGDDLLPS